MERPDGQPGAFMCSLPVGLDRTPTELRRLGVEQKVSTGSCGLDVGLSVGCRLVLEKAIIPHRRTSYPSRGSEWWQRCASLNERWCF